MKFFALFIVAIFSSTQANANSFNRGAYVHRLPSILNLSDGPGLSRWGQVFVSYTPHYMLLSGNDVNTIASISSKMSHKLGVGIKKNLGENLRLGVSYSVDLLSFNPNQGVAVLNETSLITSEFNLFSEYYFEHFSLFTGIALKERPYYTRLGSNNYDLNTDQHVHATGGAKVLAYHDGRSTAAVSGLYGYYFNGSKELIANESISALQVAIEAAYQSVEYAPEWYRIGVELYYRYESSKALSADRTLMDLGLTFKLDIAI